MNSIARISVSFWLSLAFMVLMTGCSTQSGSTSAIPAYRDPTSGSITKNDNNVILTSSEFSGTLIIDSTTAIEQDDGVVVPVFLQAVQMSDELDTITLSLDLDPGVSLLSVQTPIGYTAEIDGRDTLEPTIYFHSSATSSEQYQPIIAQAQPLFSLVLNGNPLQSMNVQAGFFFADATAYETNTQALEF